MDKNTAKAVDNRALLASVGTRLVRRVAQEDSAYALALFAVMRQRQVAWEYVEWEAALDEVDRCPLTVGEWLEQEAAR